MAMILKVTALAGAVLGLAVTAEAQLTPAEQGRKIFLANNCYGCHGDVGGGSPYGAPVLRNSEVEVDDLTEVLAEGGDRGMPAFPNLDNTTSIGYIVAYLQSLGTPSEPTFYLWWEPGIPSANLRTPRRQMYAALWRPLPPVPLKIR